MINWPEVTGFFSTLGFIDYAVLCINFALIVFARPLLQKITRGSDNQQSLDLRILLMRGVNLSIIGAYGYNWMLSQEADNSFAVKTLSIMLIVYVAYGINYLSHYVIYRNYGKQSTVNGKITYHETYRTRALNILSSLFIVSIAIVACIQQMGFNSMLEAGGAIGVLGVMVGLTQGAWAPDIISGLILLNSHIFDEGDVIEIDNNFLGLIYKIKMFHTEIINMTNNHRIMIRNSRLRDITIHNLSKFASAKGLRECLSFNIGYDVKPAKLKKMFAEITEAAISDDVAFEHKFDTEFKLLATGDHALTWGYIYYVKQVDSLINTRREMRLIALEVATNNDIDLATPLTHTAQIDPHKRYPPAIDEALPPAPLER